MVWGLRGGEPLAVLRGHIDVLSSISLGAFDGTPLAVTGSYDQNVRTWDISTGQQRDVLQRHASFVMSVQLSSSGTEACLRMRYPLSFIGAPAGHSYTSDIRILQVVLYVGWWREAPDP